MIIFRKNYETQHASLNVKVNCDYREPLAIWITFFCL